MSYVLKPPRPPTSSSSSSSAGHLLGISIQFSRLQHQCLSSGTANSPQRPSHVRAFDGELLSVCTGFTAVRRLHHLRSNCIMVATTPMAGGSGCGRHCCLGRRSQQPPFFRLRHLQAGVHAGAWLTLRPSSSNAADATIVFGSDEYPALLRFRCGVSFGPQPRVPKVPATPRSQRRPRRQLHFFWVVRPPQSAA